MLKKIKNLSKDKFLWGSFVLTVSFFIFNAANFFYHFIAARKLGPEDYAIVASLFSILYIFSVGSNVIQTSITKFAATFMAKKEFGKIKYLMKRGLRKMGICSLFLFILFIIVSPLIANFLHINITPVLLTGILLLFIFVLPINRGIMQGMQKFNSLGLNFILEGIIKVSLIVIFIYLGFKVNGAIGAVIIATIVVFIFSFVRLKEKQKKFDTKSVYSYSFPVLLAILSITAMFSLDIVLVKHLFLDERAGQYSAIALLGKIVFFGATAISWAMFSRVSELYAKNKEHKQILKKALILTSSIAFGVTLVYFFFSKLIISIVFGSEYLAVTSLLGPFAVFMTFLSLIYILSLYKLSINKKKFVYLLLIFNLIQIMGIYFFGTSLSKIVYFLIAFSAILFFSLLSIGNKVKKDGSKK